MSIITEFQENQLFQSFACWSAIMAIKMLCMMPLIGRQRYLKKIFMTPEDCSFLNKIIPNSTVAYNDPDVERPRRAFLNDLENILPWFISTSVYLMTEPAPQLAINLIRVFGICRIIHTIVYAIIVVPQPARVSAYLVGYFIIGFQAFYTLYYYVRHI